MNAALRGKPLPPTDATTPTSPIDLAQAGGGEDDPLPD
jgi:hypothetical protein